MLNIPAFEFVLSRVPWTTFHTLTFRSIRGRTESSVMVNGMGWLREIAKLDCSAWMRFTWALRFETGEATGRPHLHALIVAKEDTVRRFLVSRYGVPLAHEKWGLGLTSHRRVHGYSDPAVGYMLKGDKGGGSAYELVKTGRAQHLRLSEALERDLLKAIRMTGDDEAIETHCNKDASACLRGLAKADNGLVRVA